jgi:hypothetical protein
MLKMLKITRLTLMTLNAECFYAEYHDAVNRAFYRYAERLYAECNVVIVMLSVFILNIMALKMIDTQHNNKKLTLSLN